SALDPGGPAAPPERTRGGDGPGSGLRNVDRPQPRRDRPPGRPTRGGVLGKVPTRAREGRMKGGLFEDDGAPVPARDGFPPSTPLADRMRPRSLDEVEGPEEVVGANGFLRRAIAEDRVPSLIFWGPPGVGKTTLARLIASQTSSHFVSYSAV